MIVRKLEVKGLNTRINDAWEFNDDLNIITGRNGSGKTTLLKLIWYLMSGNLGQAISEFPFESVSMETDAFHLHLAKDSPTAGRFDFSVVGAGGGKSSFRMPLDVDGFQRITKAHRIFTQTLNRSLFFPSFRRIEGGYNYLSRDTAPDDLKWLHAFDSPHWRSADESMMILQRAMSQFSTELSVFGEHQLIAAISTHDIAELLTKTRADILNKTDEPNAELLKDTEQLSKEIIRKLDETKSLDDTVPALTDVQKRIEAINKERASALKPFDKLGDRVREAFDCKGVYITEDIALGEPDGAIDADKLSAGEKQMLSFWCYNAFNEDTAFFIDEPELSLHIDWQRRLMPDLLEERTGNQFFVATHSPFIFAKYPDKEFLLGEDRGGEV